MWDKSPSLFADVVEKAAVKRSKDIATDMLTAVVNKSPIDTTNFVGNTNVSMDAPNFTYVEGKTIGRGGAMAAGMTFIRALPNDKLHSIYISNSTPYAKYLEFTETYRGSMQAPSGVYRVSFMGVAAWYR